MDREKIKLEFLFRASPHIIYTFITSPACLVRWFCDEVDIVGNKFSFFWSGSEEAAELIESEENERLRFQWEDGEDDEYLEFKFVKSPVTGETIFTITDFCDADEVEDQKRYWETEIEKLRKETGG